MERFDRTQSGRSGGSGDRRASNDRRWCFEGSRCAADSRRLSVGPPSCSLGVECFSRWKTSSVLSEELSHRVTGPCGRWFRLNSFSCLKSLWCCSHKTAISSFVANISTKNCPHWRGTGTLLWRLSAMARCLWMAACLGDQRPTDQFAQISCCRTWIWKETRVEF